MSESTFRHTTARVPRLYKEAGKIVQKVREDGGSFKSLVFQSKHRCLKSLYALVAETLRHGSELDALLRQTQMLIKEPRLDPWLARVLITELVWRQRPLAGPAVPLKIVQSYKSQLLSKQTDSSSLAVKPVSRASRPRFVRINTLKATAEEVFNYFAEEGWNALEMPTKHTSSNEENQYASFLERISSLSGNEFLQDLHVPNLLVFPGSMEFYNLEYYHNGSLLLQDKASCMSAHLLDAPVGSIVLDMCAAPGMKTTHIAATLQNEGTVYAIEKHPDRYNSLCNVVAQSGASCVKPILGSALNVSATELPDVEYIVVDPTCSGSGMTNRKEIFNDLEDVSKERLEKLSSFQCAILRHAMTNFPKVKRIVYSTCSIFPEENEAVVEKVLKETSNFKPVIPLRGTQWMKRGNSTYNCGEYGLYAKSDVDLTNGFFVVVFERTESEYVPGEAIAQKLENEPHRNKKKKNRGSSKKSENGVECETITNPALERMKKAMGSLCEAVEKNSVELLSREATDKIKKRKKKPIEEQEDAGASQDSLKLVERKSKKKRHVLDDAEKSEENMAYIFQDSEDKNSLPAKKLKKKHRKDKKGSSDAADGTNSLSPDLPKEIESHHLSDPEVPLSSKKCKKKKRKDRPTEY